MTEYETSNHLKVGFAPRNPVNQIHTGENNNSDKSPNSNNNLIGQIVWISIPMIVVISTVIFLYKLRLKHKKLTKEAQRKEQLMNYREQMKVARKKEKKEKKRRKK